MQKITRLILPALVGLMLVLNVVILLPVANEAGAQTIKERFNGILVDHDADIDGDLDVDGTTNLDVVDIDGAVDFGGQELDIDADNDTSITADTDDQIDFEASGGDIFHITAAGVAYSEAAVIAATATTITLLSSYQPLTSSAEVTLTGITDGSVTGQVSCLVNENASDVIHVQDGTNTNLSGQADLGNDDVLCLLWDGADWLEISQVNN